MVDQEHTETDRLRDEVARLRTENEQLRSRYRVAAPESLDAAAKRQRPVRVLLLPDPLAAAEPGKASPEAIANMTRVLIEHLRKRQGDVEWRAEHDLARIPLDAQCFQVGQVLARMWDGTGPLPMTFRAELDSDGQRRLRRSLIDGEPDSDRFSASYRRQLQVVDDLLAEGQAAHGAGAKHHAIWTLKATDLVLAQLKLGLVSFQWGRDDWHEPLSMPRPEYDPRYSVDSDLPSGL